jgi:hypothetical protein
MNIDMLLGVFLGIILGAQLVLLIQKMIREVKK